MVRVCMLERDDAVTPYHKKPQGQSGEGHGFQIWLIGVAVLAHAKGFIWAPEAMAYPCML